MDEKREAIPGSLPVLIARGDSIPETWENAVFELHQNGLNYGREGPKDKGQVQTDGTMTMEIRKPLSKLFMHRGMNCGWVDLLEYQIEILGAKDSWVDPTEKSTRWEYHYHERMVGYPGKTKRVDQLEAMIHKLAIEPYKRNITAITFVPERDLASKDPPCLQRIWYTMIPGENGEQVLNMNYNFRSRNVMRAAPMNQLAFATLFQYVIDEVSARTGKPIKMGRMVDFCDSFHVSAYDQPLFAGFVKRFTPSRALGEPIESRAMDMEMIYPMLEEAVLPTEQKILAETKKIMEETGQYSVPGAYDAEVAKVKSLSAKVMDINRRVLEGKI